LGNFCQIPSASLEKKLYFAIGDRGWNNRNNWGNPNILPQPTTPTAEKEQLEY
jgi:hypothetical protein